MVQPSQSRYNFEQTLYAPDPTTWRLKPTSSLEEVIKQLALTRSALKGGQPRGRLWRIQAIYELISTVRKKLEERAPQTSGMGSLFASARIPFSPAPEVNYSQFQTEIASYLALRKTALLQEIASSHSAYVETHLDYLKSLHASNLGKHLNEGKEVLSHERVYKAAFEVYTSYVRSVLTQCDFGKMHMHCVEAITSDPELTFIGDFLEAKPDNMRLISLNGTLRSLDNNSEQLSDEVAKTSVKMLNMAITLIRGHSSEKISELELYRKAYELFHVSRFLSKETLSEAEYKLAILMLKEALESAKVLEHACMIEEIVRLLCQRKQGGAWLDILVASNPHDRAIHLCLDTLLAIRPTQEKAARVVARFLQLSRVEEEKRQLTAIQMFYIAYKSESDLVFMEFDSRRIQKNLQSKVSRTIIRDARQGDLFLLGKSKGGQVPPFMSQNPYKKFSRVIMLPQNSKLPAQSAIQWVNRTPLEINKQKAYHYFQNDASLHLSLNGNRGIWRIFNYFEYEKRLIDGMRVKKISLITEEAEGNLGDNFQLQIELSDSQLFEIMEQVSHGVDYMHSYAKILHGDIKPKNILFKRVGSSIVAGLIDFELAWKFGQAVPFTYTKWASYGTTEYTAPEVLGNKNFHGDFQKCDVFALGLIFYEWLFDEQAEWQELLSRHDKLITSSTDRELVEEMIVSDVEAPLVSLNKKSSLTPKEMLQRLTYNMLRLCPELRFTMREVVRELANIRQQLKGGPELYAPLQLDGPKKTRKAHKKYATRLAEDLHRLQFS